MSKENVVEEVNEIEEGEVIELLEETENKGFLAKAKAGCKKHWKKILVGSLVAVGGAMLLKSGKKTESGNSEIEYDDPELEDLISSENLDGVDTTEF